MNEHLLSFCCFRIFVLAFQRKRGNITQNIKLFNLKRSLFQTNGRMPRWPLVFNVGTSFHLPIDVLKLSDSRKTWLKIRIFLHLLSFKFLIFFKRAITLSIGIHINKYLARLKSFPVKGSTFKRSWLVYNPFLAATIEDDISLSYQSSDSSQSKAVPPPPPRLCSLFCFKL